jgi:hypothetical protein
MKFEILVAIVMASASISAAPLADQAPARRDTNIPANQALKYFPKKRVAEEKAAAEAKL